jgi:hypothetical protein
VKKRLQLVDQLLLIEQLQMIFADGAEVAETET